jgi:hypothetical protein
VNDVEPVVSGLTVSVSVAVMIGFVAHHGITRGTGDDAFSPDIEVSRAQMATFLQRLFAAAGIDLPAGASSSADIDGNPHADAIERGAVKVSANRWRASSPVSQTALRSMVAAVADRTSGPGPWSPRRDRGTLSSPTVARLSVKSWQSSRTTAVSALWRQPSRQVVEATAPPVLA